MATGYINSIQTLGTLDGPGVRFVVFTQGCNLRCGCCHNPETWTIDGGKPYSAAELADRIERYREYFGKEGGVTLTGGEPLLQAEFAAELFSLCRGRGINTCLDTSGSIINDSVRQLLSLTDRVLLDIKYTTDEQYRQFVGCSYSRPLEFLELAQQMGIAITLRQVIIPQLNDSSNSIARLKALADSHSCVDKIELLAFRKICQTKYDSMSVDFPFSRYDTPSPELMARLNEMVK